MLVPSNTCLTTVLGRKVGHLSPKSMYFDSNGAQNRFDESEG